MFTHEYSIAIANGLLLHSPLQTNVSYISSQNIWNGPNGRLHAPDGFPTSG